MISVKSINNNCGILTLYLTENTKPAEIKCLTKSEDDGGVYKVQYFDNGLAEYSYTAPNKKIWSSNAREINEAFETKDTPFELVENISVSVNLCSAGITKEAFKRLDESYGIMKVFKELKEKNKWGNDTLMDVF